MTTLEIIPFKDDEEKEEEGEAVEEGNDQPPPQVPQEESHYSFPGGGDDHHEEESTTTTNKPTNGPLHQHQDNATAAGNAAAATTRTVDLSSSYIQEIKDGDTGGYRRRQGHLLSMMGFSTSINPATGQLLPNGMSIINPRLLELTIAAFLAWRDVQERRSTILPNLPSLLGAEKCNFEWSIEFWNPRANQVKAITDLMNLYSNFITTTQQQQQSPKQQQSASQQLPFAVLGSLHPGTAEATSALAGGGMGIVHMTGASATARLDSTPLFARTIPTNKAIAQAIMTYLSSLNVTRVANLLSLDIELAVEFNKDLQQAATDVGIHLERLGMTRGKFQDTLVELQKSDIRYIIGVMAPDDLQIVLPLATRLNVIGNSDYFWMFPGRSEVASPKFGLPKGGPLTDAIANSFHGVALIYQYVKPSASYHQVYQQFTQSPQEQNQFLNMIPNPHDRDLFRNYTFEATHYSHPMDLMTYDAVLSLGIAACNTPGQFTGKQLHHNLLHPTSDSKEFFTGLSGKIEFDSMTGTRSSKSAAFQIVNILKSDTRSTNTTHKFDAITTAIVGGGNVVKHANYTYGGNTTIPPPTLPPLEGYDYNLIPFGMLIVGYSMCGLVIVLSLLFMAWTFFNRTKFVVSAAQPVFLIQLCLGTIIMACSIIPSSMQGETTTPQLDAACMTVPWLIYLGLVMGISAILSKTWRIGQLLDGAQSMKRVRVQPTGVAKPFAMLLIWNVGMLTGWTVCSPLRYERIELNSVDVYGRNLSSYGVCRPANNWYHLFQKSIWLADLIAVIFIIFQCYRVRSMSTYFSETNSLVWSTVSLVESAVVVGPITIASRDNPTASFFSSSLLTLLLCLSFLLPIFGFKIYNRHADYQDAKEQERISEQRIQEQKALALALGGENEYDSDGESVSSSAGRMSIKRHSSSRKPKGSSRRKDGSPSPSKRSSAFSLPSFHSARSKNRDSTGLSLNSSRAKSSSSGGVGRHSAGGLSSASSQ